MSLETVLLWLAIGLIAGCLASVVLGDGFGVVRNIAIASRARSLSG